MKSSAGIPRPNGSSARTDTAVGSHHYRMEVVSLLQLGTHSLERAPTGMGVKSNSDLGKICHRKKLETAEKEMVSGLQTRRLDATAADANTKARDVIYSIAH